MSESDDRSPQGIEVIAGRTRKSVVMPTWGKRFAEVLNHDFCPGANRWVYWIKTPVASLSLAAVAALCCAIFIKPMALVAFAAVLLVVLLGYVWPSLAIRGLEASLQFRQRRVHEGEPALSVLKVRNRWPWPVWGLSLEQGFGDRPTIALARMPGFSTAEFLWDFVPDCRGEFPQSVPRLVTGFPFGLRHASRPVMVHQTLLVWPRIVPLDTLLDAAETRPSDDVFSDTRAGDHGDMTGTRSFRQGDSLRRVHWAQTARAGRLIVTERQASSRSSVRIVFDSDRALHRGDGADSSLEWSIRIAASVAAAYHREQGHVEVCLGHEVWPVEAGSAGFQRFLDRLARWKPCAVHHSHGCDHDHSRHECHKIHHHHCGAFQITITTDIGLAHRTEHRHVHGDQRLIVLDTSRFADPCDLCAAEHASPSRRNIVLSGRSNPAEEFQRKWRQACHVG